MKVRIRAVSGLLVMVALAVAIAASPVIAGSSQGHFDRTLNVTGAVDLDVQTGSGDITLRTGDSSKVEIHARIHGSGWGDVEQHIHEIENNPPIEQSGNTIRIGHIENRDWKHNISISYELVVPSQTKLRSESGSGDQRADGISGPADMNSGSGSLHVGNIGGEVRARTGSGDIELETIRGNAHASAGSGNDTSDWDWWRADRLKRSGNVKLEQTAAGDVEYYRGSGDVEIKGVKGGAKVTTGSGSITAQGDPTGDGRDSTAVQEALVWISRRKLHSTWLREPVPEISRRPTI